MANVTTELATMPSYLKLRVAENNYPIQAETVPLIYIRRGVIKYATHRRWEIGTD